MAKASAQKFIARNRAPRVQIEYDVEVYGAEKTVQLPFVMGVMSDLSGKPAEPLPPVAERKFLEIDVDNFDDRLKAMKPRVAFAVPNTLTGEGNLQVEMTFENMDDFSPAAVARKVEPLRKLLETRTQLVNLMTYMDGKSGAEDLIANLLQNPSLLQALGSAPAPAEEAAPSAAADTAATQAAPAETEPAAPPADTAEPAQADSADTGETDSGEADASGKESDESDDEKKQDPEDLDNLLDELG